MVAGEDDAAATADVIEAAIDVVDDDMVVVGWIVVVVTEPVLRQAALRFNRQAPKLETLRR